MHPSRLEDRGRGVADRVRRQLAPQPLQAADRGIDRFAGGDLDRIGDADLGRRRVAVRGRQSRQRRLPKGLVAGKAELPQKRITVGSLTRAWRASSAIESRSASRTLQTSMARRAWAALSGMVGLRICSSSRK